MKNQQIHDIVAQYDDNSEQAIEMFRQLPFENLTQMIQQEEMAMFGKCITPHDAFDGVACYDAGGGLYIVRNHHGVYKSIKTQRGLPELVQVSGDLRRHNLRIEEKMMNATRKINSYHAIALLCIFNISLTILNDLKIVSNELTNILMFISLFLTTIIAFYILSLDRKEIMENE